MNQFFLAYKWLFEFEKRAVREEKEGEIEAIQAVRFWMASGYRAQKLLNRSNQKLS